MSVKHVLRRLSSCECGCSSTSNSALAQELEKYTANYRTRAYLDVYTKLVPYSNDEILLACYPYSTSAGILE